MCSLCFAGSGLCDGLIPRPEEFYHMCVCLRPKGRPRLRWEDDVRNDLGSMGVKNWKQKVQERKQWKEIIEQAKTHKEL